MSLIKNKSLFSTRLPQPPLLDFSNLSEEDVKIVIYSSQHKFASDAEFSGTNVMKQPIFGSKVYINGKRVSKTTYGLPFMRFSSGSNPKITYHNTTKFTFNIHYHGLDTVGAVDGVSMELVFGPSTLLGPEVTFQFPKITNNQCLLWFHAHNQYTSLELIYGGIVGLLQITDKQTEWLSPNLFEYGNNQLLLAALDMDLTREGTQTFSNLIVDENRSCFTVINGTSCVGWGDSEENQKYVNPFYHVTDRNLVKIDILNASLNWRVFHLGVCDKKKRIKSFHVVQTDSGLVNPMELKMTFVPVASRVGIIVNLDDFKDSEAYLFFYNYDLTEVLETVPTFPNEPMNPSLTATVPDFSGTEINPTPYPSPIPDEDDKNQQQINTALDYPIVPLISQTEQILQNGTIPIPAEKQKSFKIFLKITKDCSAETKPIKLNKVLSGIRKTIFGKKNYKQYKGVLKQPDFEFDPKFDYLSFLNEKYFYNLPNLSGSLREPSFLPPVKRINSRISDPVPGSSFLPPVKRISDPVPGSSFLPPAKRISGSLREPSVSPTVKRISDPVPGSSVSPTVKRNLILFFETGVNAILGGNPNGTTEFVMDNNRIMADLWNSAELDLDWALQQYSEKPNNFRPSTLPTSKFRIYKTNDEFSNTAMISNDTLNVEIYASEIAYGDFSKKPLGFVQVIFPPTPSGKHLNLQEWIDLINKTFSETLVKISGTEVNLGSILKCDWSFFPYALNFTCQKTLYIKSAVIKTENKTNYWIRFTGRWPLLQFFGKAMAGNTLDLDEDQDILSQLRKKQNKMRIRRRELLAASAAASHAAAAPSVEEISKHFPRLPAQKTVAQYTKCDEVGIFGIYDAEIQQIFPAYATFNPEIQLPIACMKRDGELIIAPNTTFIGLYDGYLNDNLNSFSVKLHSSETWIYSNGDTTDAHSLHFHLTSGYASPSSEDTSPGLLSAKRSFNSLLYSRDIYQVGPQEKIGFNLTWPNYSSEAQTNSPNLSGIGAVIHCHFLLHESVNSMMIAYFVDPADLSENEVSDSIIE